MSHNKRYTKRNNKRMNALVAMGAAWVLAFTAVPPSMAATTQPPVASQGSAAARSIQQLAADYYFAKVRFEPLGATGSGDNRFDDQLGLSISPANRANQMARYRQFMARLVTIDPAKLDADDRTSHAILDYEIRAELAALQFPDHLLPVDQLGNSVPIALAQLADGTSSQPISTPQQYRAFLNRLKQLTPWIDQAIANMREGVKASVVLPKALIESALPHYKSLPSSSADTSLFYAAIKRLPKTFSISFSAADQRTIAIAYRVEIDRKLNPALRRLAAFLENEYLPAGRPSAGYSALPGGSDWYKQRVAYNTTTSLTPAQIHTLGLAEVARIQQQFAAVGPKIGYSGPAAGLPKWMGEQPQVSPFKNEQDILAVYRKLDGVLADKLPAMFTLTPKASLEVRLEPELTRATAYDRYTGPSADGKRPGIFWVVVNDAALYDQATMTTLFLHEGRPGHHFQIALQTEQSLPDFRRFGGNNAYVEGWALYAESLGIEMGLYSEPDQYFGHLNDELLRAARLVVDTGLHAQGWTREQAIAYLRDTNGYSEAVAKSAIERYMAWPGQALGYKLGSLKIAELRQRAEKALGPKFNLAAFHAIVLGSGSLPLAVLEQSVDRWIAGQ